MDEFVGYDITNYILAKFAINVDSLHRRSNLTLLLFKANSKSKKENE